MTEKLFFDTYALIEIYKESGNYEKYKKTRMILSMLNLIEFVYFLIREKRESEINEIFDKLSRFAIPYDKEILVNAARMKYRNKKERLSFIDCVGYKLAKKHHCRFLTGDERFRNKENVEFVK